MRFAKSQKYVSLQEPCNSVQFGTVLSKLSTQFQQVRTVGNSGNDEARLVQQQQEGEATQAKNTATAAATVQTGKRPVIKTTTRQTYFLLVIGLVVPEKLKPGNGSEQGLVRRTSSWTLPAEYDARVKAMEVDERPTEH
ncbi:26S protease regulatory subunit 6a [Culex quinquefasciatus]|uniref:26S protease regulatory subunit 6a n=1 Tax=Culex quinquefasciatus TaxID=7176 RepID=B0XHC8_CULQU|nr:26S protease regulatory subunit 6a [Culex quinquefasciatus]|eukprot:XP_001869050.1 26S protease regulatory subunit 6a [Culex quinquefasciatus]